jgi:hypothetical protein
MAPVDVRPIFCKQIYLNWSLAVINTHTLTDRRSTYSLTDGEIMQSLRSSPATGAIPSLSVVALQSDRSDAMWQKDYFKGRDVDGRIAEGHQTVLHLKAPTKKS